MRIILKCFPKGAFSQLLSSTCVQSFPFCPFFPQYYKSHEYCMLVLKLRLLYEPQPKGLIPYCANST